MKYIYLPDLKSVGYSIVDSNMIYVYMNKIVNIKIDKPEDITNINYKPITEDEYQNILLKLL